MAIRSILCEEEARQEDVVGHCEEGGVNLCSECQMTHSRKNQLTDENTNMFKDIMDREKAGTRKTGENRRDRTGLQNHANPDCPIQFPKSQCLRGTRAPSRGSTKTLWLHDCNAPGH